MLLESLAFASLASLHCWVQLTVRTKAHGMLHLHCTLWLHLKELRAFAEQLTTPAATLLLTMLAHQALETALSELLT